MNGTGTRFISPFRRGGGFTLLELVIVIAVMALLMTVGVGTFQRSMASQKLSTGTVLLANEFARVAQLAVKENRTIHVRFLRRAEQDVEGYRAWTLLAADRSTGVLEPLAEEQRLPTGVVFLDDDTHSNILHHVSEYGDDLPLGFKPKGGTTLPVTADSRWCLTLVLENDLKDGVPLPPNHRTLLINAHTGAVTAY